MYTVSPSPKGWLTQSCGVPLIATAVHGRWPVAAGLTAAWHPARAARYPMPMPAASSATAAAATPVHTNGRLPGEARPLAPGSGSPRRRPRRDGCRPRHGGRQATRSPAARYEIRTSHRWRPERPEPSVPPLTESSSSSSSSPAVVPSAGKRRVAHVLGDERHRGVRKVGVAGTGGKGERAEFGEDRGFGRAVARHALQAGGDQSGQFLGQAGQVRRLGREPDENVHDGLALVGRMAGARRTRASRRARRCHWPTRPAWRPWPAPAPYTRACPPTLGWR